jgi:hypothetical protein
MFSGDLNRAKWTKHGHAPAGNPSPEYNSWRGARDRCVNPKHISYRFYGAKGVEFRFVSFEEFLAELGPKPSPEHTVDRIDSTGHYEVGNVRWATRKEQFENQRVSREFIANQQRRRSDTPTTSRGFPPIRKGPNNMQPGVVNPEGHPARLDHDALPDQTLSDVGRNPHAVQPLACCPDPD